MYQQHYFVPKATGTLTDTLLAFGAATLIRQFVRSHLQDDKVILRDAGSYYLIDAGVPVQEEWLTESWEQQLFWFVVSAKNKVPDDLAPLAASHSVDDTWDEFRQYQELRKQLRDEKLANDEIKQVLEDRKPQSDWTVITYSGGLPHASPGNPQQAGRTVDAYQQTVPRPQSAHSSSNSLPRPRPIGTRSPGSGRKAVGKSVISTTW